MIIIISIHLGSWYSRESKDCSWSLRKPEIRPNPSVSTSSFGFFSRRTISLFFIIRLAFIHFAKKGRGWAIITSYDYLFSEGPSIHMTSTFD